MYGRDSIPTTESHCTKTLVINKSKKRGAAPKLTHKKSLNIYSLSKTNGLN